MSVKILPIKTFLSKVFLGTKYVEKVKRKVGRTVFQDIKNLTNHNSNIPNSEAAIMKDSVK